MVDQSVDWRYRFPCADRLPDEVARGLDPYFRKLASLDERGVRAALRERWTAAPVWLQPLAKRVLSYRHLALVGAFREAYVELTARSPWDEHEWEPCEWMTPWEFLPDGARKYLREHGISAKKLRRYDRADLERQARDVAHVMFSDNADIDAMSLYVRAPNAAAGVARALRRVGQRSRHLAQFVLHFGGMRESPPKMCGELSGPDDLCTFEKYYASFGGLSRTGMPASQLRHWRRATVIFHSLGGDLVLAHQKGPVAWYVMPEHRVDERWPSIQKFAAGYAKALLYRYPFDSYGR